MSQSVITFFEHKEAFASTLNKIILNDVPQLKQVYYHILLKYYKTKKNLKTMLQCLEHCAVPNQKELISSIKYSILTNQYRIRTIQFSPDDTVDEDDLDPWEYISELYDTIGTETHRSRKLARMRAYNSQYGLL
jgi:hypothetical protein